LLPCVADADKHALKRFCGEFDLNNVFHLDASKQGITSVAQLAQCQNLITLNLSHNGIADITALASLVQLKVINLAFNHISSLKAIKSMRVLECLDLRENLVAKCDDLVNLGHCCTLQEVMLQDVDGQSANPVCFDEQYWPTMTSQVNLVAVDGKADYFKLQC
jgi:Leucine-rich repeat (LRR) protein